MGNINENIHGNQSLRDKLSAIILLETAKLYEEIDCDLVDECIDFLMELEGRKRLGKKEIRRRIGKIPFRENILKFNEAARRKVKAKRIAIVAAIMAIIMAIIGVMSIASEDIFGDLLAKFGKQFVEQLDTEAVKYGGVVMYNADETRDYDTIEELLKTEKIDMLYPSWLPEGVEIEFASHTVEFEQIVCTICCNDTKFFITMYPQKALNDEIKTNLCIKINDLEIYYFSENGVTQGNFVYKNNLYSVTADSPDNLFKIIENLKEIN
ncbi:MAG: hypothetical protein IJE48_05785 [Clostridia bacterium]|nr:hypothetical protein [Clostridia bacterium]